MKKYRFKKRFFVIVVTASLIVTGYSIIHIDKVCGADDKNLEIPVVEEAQAASVLSTTPIITEADPPEPELTSLGEYKITYYCACEKCCGVWAKNRPKDENGNPIVKTASGAVAQAGKTIAVDPSVIPYGTEVIINGHTYTAQDCGGAIKGNRIDIYCESHEEALQNGVDHYEVFMEV